MSPTNVHIRRGNRPSKHPLVYGNATTQRYHSAKSSVPHIIASRMHGTIEKSTSEAGEDIGMLTVSVSQHSMAVAEEGLFMKGWLLDKNTLPYIIYIPPAAAPPACLPLRREGGVAHAARNADARTAPKTHFQYGQQ